MKQFRYKYNQQYIVVPRMRKQNNVLLKTVFLVCLDEEIGVVLAAWVI